MAASYLEFRLSNFFAPNVSNENCVTSLRFDLPYMYGFTCMPYTLHKNRSQKAIRWRFRHTTGRCPSSCKATVCTQDALQATTCGQVLCEVRIRPVKVKHKLMYMYLYFRSFFLGFSAVRNDDFTLPRLHVFCLGFFLF